MKVDLEQESTISFSWPVVTTCKQETEELVREKKKKSHFYLSRKVCVQRYGGHPGSVTTAFFGGFKSLPCLQYNHPDRGYLKAGCSQMSLVGIVSNTSKDVVGLPSDLQCDTPVTLSPNNSVTCSAFLFNSSMGKDCCSRCHLPTSGVSPPEVGASLPGWHLVPWKSLLAGKIGFCAGACSWIQLFSMVLF